MTKASDSGIEIQSFLLRPGTQLQNNFRESDTKKSSIQIHIKSIGIQKRQKQRGIVIVSSISLYMINCGSMMLAKGIIIIPRRNIRTNLPALFESCLLITNAHTEQRITWAIMAKPITITLFITKVEGSRILQLSHSVGKYSGISR